MFLLVLFILIQVVLEALPVSSSGHLALFKLFLMEKFKIVFFMPEFFDDFLHGSAVLIILVLFFKDWFLPFKYLINSFNHNKKRFKLFLNLLFKIISLVLVVDSITAAFYFLYHKSFADGVTNNPSYFLIVGFSITTVLLIFLYIKEKYFISRIESFDFKKAIILGFVQGVALFPGISRFASTYVVLRLLNLSVRRAFQISFLVQFPLILAGFARGAYCLFKDESAKVILSPAILFILFLASIVSYFLLKFTYKLAKQNRLWIFCIYTLFIVFIILFCFFIF